jgi:hypothetical protein
MSFKEWKLCGLKEGHREHKEFSHAKGIGFSTKLANSSVFAVSALRFYIRWIIGFSSIPA